MNFINLKSLTIPEGKVKKITVGGIILWQKNAGESFVNAIPLSVDTSGAPFIGDNGEKGYQRNRVIATGTGVASVKNGYCSTGFIPVKRGDVVYFKGLSLDSSTQGPGLSSGLHLYNSSFVQQVGQRIYTIAANGDNYIWSNATYDSFGRLTSITINDKYNEIVTDKGGYLRLSCAVFNEYAIVSINQPIPEDIPYTNLLPTAINSDGTPFNGGKGWKTGYRLNSTGGETAVSGMECTGFIPITQSDALYLSGITMPYDGASNSQQYVCFYNSNFEYITNVRANSGNYTYGMTEYYDTHDLAIVHMEPFCGYYNIDEAKRASIAYFRMSAPGIDDNSVITVNQYFLK